jgi:hypothetical protein
MDTILVTQPDDSRHGQHTLQFVSRVLHPVGFKDASPSTVLNNAASSAVRQQYTNLPTPEEPPIASSKQTKRLTQTCKARQHSCQRACIAYGRLQDANQHCSSGYEAGDVSGAKAASIRLYAKCSCCTMRPCCNAPPPQLRQAQSILLPIPGGVDMKQQPKCTAMTQHLGCHGTVLGMHHTHTNHHHHTSLPAP